MKRILLILTLLAALAPSALSAEKIPEPSGRVNDLANVIPQDYRDKLTSLISEVETKTGAEIAIVTIDSIAPYDEKSYARMIFDKWKIGKKGKDNGVLVMLAMKERAWRIETGYGLEGILPDGLCGEIGRNYMVPYFKDGRFGEGLYAGASRIAAIIAKDSKVSLEGAVDAAPQAIDSDTLIFLYIFVPIFFFMWNLPWPVYIGLPFTALFALIFLAVSPIVTILTVIAYIASLITRLFYWNRLPRNRRDNFFGPQNYGGHWGTGSGGWGGGGLGGGFGGGGFGGGLGGGGGAGGRW